MFSPTQVSSRPGMGPCRLRISAAARCFCSVVTPGFQRKAKVWMNMPAILWRDVADAMWRMEMARKKKRAAYDGSPNGGYCWLRTAGARRTAAYAYKAD